MAAFAAHGKPGLWEITTRMNMPGMTAQIPPEALACMRAMGVQMPDSRSFTTQHCMTPEEVAADKPPPMRNNKYCTMNNSRFGAHSFTADMTCSGEMQGQGHVSVTYDGDEHYSGNYTFTGSAQGHPQNMTTSFEGKWISADCGSVK
ncbi:MAG: DUF3617 domain-containing protein [Rhizomicrobium sp.]